MTTGARMVELSTLDSGTALEHFLNIRQNITKNITYTYCKEVVGVVESPIVVGVVEEPEYVIDGVLNPIEEFSGEIYAPIIDGDINIIKEIEGEIE